MNVWLLVLVFAAGQPDGHIFAEFTAGGEKKCRALAKQMNDEDKQLQRFAVCVPWRR